MEWIAVEDEYPCFFKEFLYYNGRIGITTRFHDDDESWYSTEGRDIHRITHWMPLPPPPTGD